MLFNLALNVNLVYTRLGVGTVNSVCLTEYRVSDLVSDPKR